ncbi:MAG: LON peptidase substrate-binding domain-containing protein [Myxococcota bacterium]
MTIVDSLALFPLSDVVLLPEVSVPLYIFEPRYRQMTRVALEGSMQIGMVTVRPDSVDAMAGDPPIFEIGCIGRIAHAQQRPDGTYQIMLIGEQRFRILEEDSRDAEQLYRSARVALLEDVEPTTDAEFGSMETARETLLELVERLIRRIGTAEDPARAMEPFEKLESPRLVNALAQSIAFSPIERQQLLQADSIVGRCETLSELLRFRLAATGMTDGGGAPLPN